MGVTFDPSGKRLTNATESLRVVPLLVASLMTGLTIFTCIAVAMGPVSPVTPTGSPSPTAQPPLPENVLYAALGALGAGCLVAYFVFGAWCTTKAKAAWQARTSDDDGNDAIARLLMTTTILRAALVEGPGLFGAVLILLTGSLATIAAPVVALVLLAMLLPARSRLETLLAESKT